MKKHVILVVIFMLTAAFFAGCGEKTGEEIPGGASLAVEETAAPAPVTTPAPEAGQPAFDGVTFTDKKVIYPEDAAEDEAVFILEYALPVFDSSVPACDKLNAAVLEYESELLDRVNSERLPFADGVGAYTHADIKVFAGGEYINIAAFETTSFDGEEEEVLVRTLVLDGKGNVCTLGAVTGRYDIDTAAAQQVFNLIDADRNSYFGDITLEDIPAAIDVYTGFTVTDDEIVLYAAPGTLAPAENGVLEFAVAKRAFYPEVVGEIMTEEEYEALAIPLNDLAASCGLEYSGFEGAPAGFVATRFMTRRFTSGDEEGAFIAVPAAEYEGEYSRRFGSDFSESLIENGDGTYFENGNYMVPVYPRSAWSFRTDDAVKTGDGMVIYGMILFGVPGTEGSGELCPATVTLAMGDEGYCFKSVELR